VTLSLPVIQTREVEAGRDVGYAMGWQADRPTHVATVAAGYADGLPRALSNKGSSGRRCALPILGRVSMDMIAADISHLDGSAGCAGRAGSASGRG
jgi:alanine racemase